MTKTGTIAMMFLMALGTLFAQETKSATTQPPYFCISGVPMWRGLDEPADAKVRAAAKSDCKAQYEKESADEAKLFRETEELMAKMHQDLAEHDRKMEAYRQRICRFRTHFLKDGTDDPDCKDVAPRLDLLQNAHDVCRLIPNMPDCDRLLPLSMGKAINFIKVAHEPGLFTGYSEAKVTLQGVDGTWEDTLGGEKRQVVEFVGFQANKKHILTVTPKSDTDMTFKYAIPAGTSFTFELKRTFCNTTFSGYSLYREGQPTIWPKDFDDKGCH